MLSAGNSFSFKILLKEIILIFYNHCELNVSTLTWYILVMWCNLYSELKLEKHNRS